MIAPTIPGTEPHLLIVADNLLTRAGLSALLAERGCIVLAQSDGADLQEDIELHGPDALVIDLGWSNATMRECLSQIESDLPVLALTGQEEGGEMAALLPLLQVFPQFALLQRDSDADMIVAAVSALIAGLTVIDPRLTGILAAPALAVEGELLSPLTLRESEVLQLLAGGLTNRAIAHELGITQHTVKFHVNAILSKLNAQSRTEAVVRATQIGLIAL